MCTWLMDFGHQSILYSFDESSKNTNFWNVWDKLYYMYITITSVCMSDEIYPWCGTWLLTFTLSSFSPISPNGWIWSPCNHFDISVFKVKLAFSFCFLRINNNHDVNDSNNNNNYNNNNRESCLALGCVNRPHNLCLFKPEWGEFSTDGQQARIKLPTLFFLAYKKSPKMLTYIKYDYAI